MWQLQLAAKMGWTSLAKLAGLPHPEEHFPDWQVCPEGQAAPHAPQLLLSIWRLVHLPLQVMRPDAQAQVPLVQACPAAHALPQPPQ